MEREIRYCDRCAQLVSPGDFASGKASVTDGFVVCASCAKLQAAERASAPRPPAPVAAGSPAAVRPRSRSVPERPAGGSQARTFAIAAVVAALVTVPVAVLVMRGPGERPGPSRPQPLPVAGPRVPSPRLPEPRTPGDGDAPTAGEEAARNVTPAPAVERKVERKVERNVEEPADAGIIVYHFPGKNRVHVKECRRLTSTEGATTMTLAEAEARGLPLCSRCPGSATPGKGNKPGLPEPGVDPPPTSGADD